jgi:hypothetical protein
MLLQLLVVVVQPQSQPPVPTPVPTPGPNQILGIPTFARQTPGNLTFAPLRRGLAQLRPAMSMTGLTSGQAAFGGVAPTPVQPLGGVVRPPPATPYALPEDFVLQTGAYGAPTPTFLDRNSTAAGPAGVDQPTYAQLLDNVQRLSAQVQTLLPANRAFYDYGGGGGGGFESNPNPSSISLSDFGNAFANAFGFGDESGGSVGPAGGGPSGDGPGDESGGSVGGTGSPGDDGGTGSPGDDGGTGSPAGDFEAGGLIKMAEGGGPPKMAELSVEDLGSTFDISKYIDDEGRLVGGMSKPIRDAYGKIIGYESGDLPLPIQRDVVFNPILARREEEERERMRNMAEGGLANVAQNLAERGRKGDSMLVHMTPDEVAGLQALAQQMGSSLTINPETGLPEANIFKKLLPVALGFALGPAGFGVFQSALSAGLAVGAGYTLATGSLQQGISAGLGAYGGSNLGTGLQAAGTAGTADAATSAAASEATGSGLQVAGSAGGDAASAAMVNPMAHPDFAGTATGSGLDLSLSPNYSLAAPPPSPTSISLTGGAGSGLSLTPEATGFTATGPAIPGSEELFTQQIPIDSVNLATGARETAMSTVPKTSSVLPSDVTGLGSTPTPGSALTGAERYFGDKATSDLAAQRYADATGSTLGTSAMQILGGISLQSAADEQEAIKAQQAAIDEKRERRKRLFEEIAERTLGRVNVRSGGLMQLAGGGMSYMEAGGTTGPTGAPREVVGNGDGMSDSVPADIEGVQEARLADGEFVIPADVVADIGNGSSDAGSKKLYDMMDRIRKARHGTTEQPPEIQAERLMPA